MAKLLIVDDSAALVSMVGKLLKGEHLILAALSGKEGLQRIESERPDLVILDLHLPDMEGFYLCRKVRANPELKALPIILISGDDSTTVRAQGLEAGANDFLCKPFKVEQLRSLIDAHLIVRQTELPET